MLPFVCFLTVLQIWAGFLHVCTSFLQGLALAATGSMLQELTTGWGKAVEHWGCLYQLGGSMGEPSGSLVAFLMECTTQLVGSMFF